jgi:hypothetical protein
MKRQYNGQQATFERLQNEVQRIKVQLNQLTFHSPNDTIERMKLDLQSRLLDIKQYLQLELKYLRNM